MADYPFTADARSRLRFVWDRFLDMAKKYPKRLKVQQQLRASGRLLKDAEAPNIVIMELLHTTKEGAEMGGLHHASAEYLVLMFRLRLKQRLSSLQLIGSWNRRVGNWDSDWSGGL